jgi:hypothetical protein
MLLRRPRMSVFGLTDNIYVTQLASTCFLLRIFHRSDAVVTTIPDSFRNIPGTELHREAIHKTFADTRPRFEERETHTC